MATIEEIYQGLLVAKPCPPWPDYPGEAQPGGREMIRDKAHPCSGCLKEELHLVPGRSDYPALDEAGGTLPFSAVYLWPSADCLYRAMCINDMLFFAAAGAITAAGISNNFDGMGNLFNSEVLSGTVVSASGQILTVKSSVNPLDLIITRYELNPDYDGVDPEEPLIVNRGIRSRVQTGDTLGFVGSPLAGKVTCRVEEVLSTSWGGPNATWQVRVDQTVTAADVPFLPVFDTPLFGITREAVAPRHWPEIRAQAPLYVARIEGLRITREDMLASPLSPRVELLNTGGASCRVAVPSAPNALLGWAGSFAAIKKHGSGGSSDVTDTVIDALQVEHIGSSGYRTTIDAGALLTSDGDELVLTYEPEWRSADGKEVKRASCQALCQHSKYHPVMGWACGLGGRRVLDPADDNNPANDPPTGLAKYREGVSTGCYQIGTCSDWEPRVPWSWPLHGEVWLRLMRDGYVAREEQTIPGSQAPSNFTTQRPFFPSGAPGLGPMAGRVARSADGYHAIKRLIPDGAYYGWVTGTNGSRKFRYGAEIELTDGIRNWDLSALEAPKTGLFDNRSSGGAVDGFGEAWTGAEDPTFGFRDAGGSLPSCSTADSGLTAGPGEGDRQHSTFRRPAIPRVSLGTGAAGATQSGPDGLSALLNEDDTLLLALHPLGQQADNGYGKTAKRGGTVAAASNLGGGLIKIQLANEYRNCTVAGPSSESFTRHKTGGHFVTLSDAYQPFDPNDLESKYEAANPYRGCMRGDSCLFGGVGGSDAAEFATAGFHVLKALACNGDSEPWGGGNPAPPAGWIAAPKNYTSWLHKRDVVWLQDREDGLLASNLANLVGTSISCVVGGIIAPDSDVVVLRGAYQEDWTPVDAGDIESIDRWRGRIVLKASYIQSLDRTKQHCFRVEATLCDRRRPVSAEWVREIARRQGKMTTMRGVIASGGDGRVYSVSQAENPFSLEWGQNQRAIVSAEMFSNQSTLLGTEPRPDLLIGLGEECDPDYYAEGEAILRTSTQQPGFERNVFSVGVTTGSPSVSFRNLNRAAELRLADYTGVELGKPSWPLGTQIVRATCQMRAYGLKHRKHLNEFAPDGGGGWTFTQTEIANTEGSAQLKLGLYGYKVDPMTGEVFATLVGSGGTFTSTDGEWRTADVTELAKQMLIFKPSEYVAFGITPIPTLVDITAGSDVGESLAAALPEVTFAVYQPQYSGCGGSPTAPIANASATLREGSWESEQIEWGSFEATDLVYTLSWPSDFGENCLTLNDSNGHNWPPKI